MKLLRAAMHKRMPWKNGGGETVEVAVVPEGAGLGDFDWRVSMATVVSDGPFSIFEGIDRTLSILSGAGMALAIDGRPPVHLDPSSSPFAFPADAPVDATLTEGPITDLNVMTRRGRYVHQVERLKIAGRQTFSPGRHCLILLVCDRDLNMVCEGRPIDLAPQDAIVAEDGPAFAVYGRGEVISICLETS